MHLHVHIWIQTSSLEPNKNLLYHLMLLFLFLKKNCTIHLVSTFNSLLPILKAKGYVTNKCSSKWVLYFEIKMGSSLKWYSTDMEAKQYN
jgi:hypothetical protein